MITSLGSIRAAIHVNPRYPPPLDGRSRATSSPERLQLTNGERLYTPSARTALMHEAYLPLVAPNRAASPRPKFPRLWLFLVLVHPWTLWSIGGLLCCVPFFYASAIAHSAFRDQPRRR